MAIYDDIIIFIPTKNRLNKPDTYNLLLSLGLSPIVVIEPQEEQTAKNNNFNYLVLPENDKGITYVRNWILNYCRKNNIIRAVMMDDDIKYFSRVINGTCKKDNTAFLDALTFFSHTNTCGTMQYSQFGWCQNKAITLNNSIEVIHFLYLPVLNNIHYEPNTIEDRDFALQLIFKGINIFRLNWLCFDVPTIGSNAGGLNDQYANGRHIQWAKNFINKWGSNIVKIVVKKNGHLDIRINWRKAKEMSIGNK